MFIKTDILAKIDSLKTTLANASDDASRDLHSIKTGLQDALEAWQAKLDEVYKRRDTIDAEEALIHEEVISKVNDAITTITAMELAMGNSEPAAKKIEYLKRVDLGDGQ